LHNFLLVAWLTINAGFFKRSLGAVGGDGTEDYVADDTLCVDEKCRGRAEESVTAFDSAVQIERDGK
jgi:hypothetical protein